MVCVPCFIVPIILFIFHKFIQPYILRYWNPWGKKNEKELGDKLEKMLCKDGTCYRTPTDTTCDTTNGQEPEKLKVA